MLDYTIKGIRGKENLLGLYDQAVLTERGHEALYIYTHMYVNTGALKHSSHAAGVGWTHGGATQRPREAPRKLCG